MATAIELSAYDVWGVCKRYFKDYRATDPTKDASQLVNNFEVNCFNLKPISDDPAGFLGSHRYLVVEVTVKNAAKQDAKQKLRFFTKSAPIEIASRMEYLEEFGVFKKEISVYRDVLPKFQDIFEGIAPKCYYADNNWLVFEDLHQQGYRMGAGRDGLYDREHLKCAIKNLAALHAASLIYEVRQNLKIDELNPLAAKENAYPETNTPEHMRFRNFINAIKVFKAFLKEMPKYSEQLNYIFNHIQDIMFVIFKFVKTSTKYRNVFSHGDLWANNIMFQYGKYGEIPTQSCFVDFQLARYAPPMLDLITLLTIPTTREFRQKYLMELLADYYRYMTDFLKHEHFSIEDFITEQEFYASFEEFRICGLIESCLFSHLTILPPDLTKSLTASTDGFTDFFDHKREEICLKAFTTDETYRTRLTDMLEDLVDNFIVKS